MNKVLIICDVYPPSFAPRMGYLVKYMKELGWTADIITRAHDGDFSFKSLLGEEKVIRTNVASVKINNKIDVFRKFLTQKSLHRKNVNLISNKIIQDLKSNDYKLILCSTAHRTYILEIAHKVSEKWSKPWVADIRDLDEQNPKTKANKFFLFHYFYENYKKFQLKNRNKSFNNSNAIVAVSPWHLAQLKKYNSATSLIYNGYCPEHFYYREPNNKKTFDITYTGLIVSIAHRNPSLLFLAVKQLKDNKVIDNRFRIQFYTPKNRRTPILEMLEYKAISEFVYFYDYVDTKEVPKVLADSSILLLLTNKFNQDGPKGIMTTKYFEYLAMERPVLCVRSDEDLLEASIKEANAGIAARNVDEVYSFLLSKWNEWKQTGLTTIDINREYTKQFSRKLQAKQFINLFNEVIKK